MWYIRLENGECFEKDMYVWSMFQRHGLIFIFDGCGAMEVLKKNKFLYQFLVNLYCSVCIRGNCKTWIQLKKQRFVPFNKFTAVLRSHLLSSCDTLQLQLQVLNIWVLIT